MPDVRGLEAEAYQQGGYFSVDQAGKHGVSRQLLNHHVRQGRFERVRRGLYRVRGFPTSEHDEMREKWMAVGMDKAVLSHASALALLELSDNVPDRVHLLVPRRHLGRPNLRQPGTAASSGTPWQMHCESAEEFEVSRQGGLPSAAGTAGFVAHQVSFSTPDPTTSR